VGERGQQAFVAAAGASKDGWFELLCFKTGRCSSYMCEKHLLVSGAVSAWSLRGPPAHTITALLLHSIRPSPASKAYYQAGLHSGSV